MKRDYGVRLLSLDALRGVASCIVVLFHCCQYLPALASVRLARFLLPGSGAVLVFFVLSGLVLSMTFVYRDGESLVPFVIKRIARIWPPFAVTVVVSAALSVLILDRNVVGVTPTFFEVWNRPLTGEVFLSQLLMLGNETSLDPPMWTLIQELRISILFPFIVIATMHRWRLVLFVSIIVALGVGAFQSGSVIGNSFLLTLRLIFLFILGIIIALKMPVLRKLAGEASSTVRLFLWSVSYLVLCASPDFSSMRLNHLDDVRLLVHGAAAFCIVLLCASGGRSTRLLSNPLGVYLGRISYSLYLWHQVVIVTTVYLLESWLPASALVPLGAALSVCIADISERFLERPTIRMGRKLARWSKDGLR